MTGHGSIADALSAFQAEMPTVAKSKRAVVPTKAGGRYEYTYAALADVQAAAMPLLTKHGLAFTCLPQPAEGGAYVLVGRLMHATGNLEGSLPLYGRQAQELGSSITYARRYLFGALTGVVTDDDDDGQGAQGRSRTTAQPAAKPAEDAPKRTAQRKPLPPPVTDEPPLDDAPSDTATDAQLRRLGVAFREAEIVERGDRLAYVARVIGREVASSKELTKHEASRVIDALAAPDEAEPPDPADGDDPWAGKP